MSERRKALFTGQQERIEHAHAKAVEDNLDRPVILVLDCADPFAKDIAIACAGADRVSERIDACRRSGQDAVLIYPVEYGAAVDTFLKATASGNQQVDAIISRGMIPVALFGDGGVSWVGLPPVS